MIRPNNRVTICKKINRLQHDREMICFTNKIIDLRCIFPHGLMWLKFYNIPMYARREQEVKSTVAQMLSLELSE